MREVREVIRQVDKQWIAHSTLPLETIDFQIIRGRVPWNLNFAMTFNPRLLFEYVTELLLGFILKKIFRSFSQKSYRDFFFQFNIFSNGSPVFFFFYISPGISPKIPSGAFYTYYEIFPVFPPRFLRIVHRMSTRVPPRIVFFSGSAGNLPGFLPEVYLCFQRFSVEFSRKSFQNEHEHRWQFLQFIIATKDPHIRLFYISRQPSRCVLLFPFSTAFQTRSSFAFLDGLRGMEKKRTYLKSYREI